MGLSDTQVITIMLVAIILCLVFFSALVYFMFFYKKTQKEINEGINDTLSKKDNGSDVKITEGSILLDFDFIYDNIIVSKKASSMIIQCDGINFDLMSENEKDILYYKYVSLFKNLSSPIQIFVKTDTETHDTENEFSVIYEKAEKDFRKDFMQYKQFASNSSANPESVEKFKNQLRKKETLVKYFKDFAAYTQEVNQSNNIISKYYYIIVSITEEERLQKNLIDYKLVKHTLMDRTTIIQKYLNNCDIKNFVLNQYELCDLLYLLFNKNDEKFTKFKELLNAGVFKNYLRTSQQIKK